VTSPAPDEGAPVQRDIRRKSLGDYGENLAAAWYRRQGFDVVARNWRCREGELDVVASKPGILVFCEVKTRSSRQFGHPAEAVTVAKQAKLRKAALRFIAETHRGFVPELRFDVAAVEHGKVEMYEACF
jgi:putative endonuclease